MIKFLNLVMALTSVVLVGCVNAGDKGADVTEGSSSSNADFSYWTLDRRQEIRTGDEPWAQNANIIKQCENDSSGAPLVCHDTCVSRWFPQNRRYTLYLSGYVPTNRCYVTILETPSQDGIPAGYEFYEGAYETYTSGGLTKGRCINIDEDFADEVATHAFSTCSTPEGQVTANPWGKRSYDLLNLYSLSGTTLQSSMYLQTWQTPEGGLVNPGRFSYLEANTSGNDLVFTQMNGFTCVKREEITNSVIRSFQPGY